MYRYIRIIAASGYIHYLFGKLIDVFGALLAALGFLIAHASICDMRGLDSQERVNRRNFKLTHYLKLTLALFLFS